MYMLDRIRPGLLKTEIIILPGKKMATLKINSALTALPMYIRVL